MGERAAGMRVGLAAQGREEWRCARKLRAAGASIKRRSVKQHTDFGTSKVPQSVYQGWTDPSENA